MRNFERKRALFAAVIFFLAGLQSEPSLWAAPKYDYVIQEATVFDGESLSGKIKDVGIQGDKIVKVGKIRSRAQIETIDGKNLVLTPGFIDTHTHSDFNPIVYPDLANKTVQGVTTEVVGNCGMSAAPLLGAHGSRIGGVWAREGVEIPAKLPWRSFKEYRTALESSGMMTNFAALAGHGNLRSAVMGFSSRPASAGEIDEMRTMLRQAMKEGAAGISYGLIYVPGIYADQEELTQLCHEAGLGGGLCAFHMRSEGGALLESISEVLEIGTKANAPVEISHLKAGGKNNWGKIEDAFNLIETARRKGQRVKADVYPYTGSYAELGVVLPDEIYKKENRSEYFRDTSKREELLNLLRKYYESRDMKWDSVMIAATPHEKFQSYEGKTLKQISRDDNVEPEEFLIKILAQTNFEVSAYFFAQSDEVVSKVVRQSYTTIGSDSIADGSRKPHPRAFGTFPKILADYARDRRELPLGEAVRKMTALSADAFSLKKRGRIKKGYYADLVLFHLSEIKDLADYENPKISPKGIRWVFVNGKPAVQNGKPTGIKNGRFLSPQKE